ncbi:MAG: hypothetical protein KGI84_05365 [Elusimicrobia bacterium]|nr:hypothetical protein [Elusimicrobiota bacterium]
MARERLSRLIAALRARVIRTRNRRVWLSLYRSIYLGAVALFSAAVRLRFGNRASLYLRRGMARQDWTPGISDVDLIAILDDGTSDKTETAQKFWRLYSRFKRVFPFFGELQITNPLEIRDYARRGGWRAREMPGWRPLGGKPALGLVPEENASTLKLFHLQEALAAYLSLAQTYFEAAGKKEPPEFGFKVSKFFIDIFRHERAAAQGALEVPGRQAFLSEMGSGVAPESAEILRRPDAIDRNQARRLLLEAMNFADDACGRYFSDEHQVRHEVESPNATEWYNLADSPDPHFALWSRRMRTLAALHIPGGCGFFMDNLFRWFVVLDHPPTPEHFEVLAARMDRWHLRENAFSAPGWALTYNILQGLLYSPFLDSPFLAHGLGPAGDPRKIWLLKHSRRHQIWAQYYRLQWNIDTSRLSAPGPEDMRMLARQTAAALGLSARVLALDSKAGHNAYRIFFLLTRMLAPRLYLDDGLPLDAQDADAVLGRYRAKFPESASWLERLESEWLSLPETEANSAPAEAFFRSYWPFFESQHSPNS